MGNTKINEEIIIDELRKMREDLDFIKSILVEEGELTDEAQGLLKEARTTSEKDYIRVEDL